MNRTEYFSFNTSPTVKKKKEDNFPFGALRCVYVHHHSECVRSLIITCRSLSRRVDVFLPTTFGPSSVVGTRWWLFSLLLLFLLCNHLGSTTCRRLSFSFLFHLYISALGPPRQIIIFMILGYTGERLHTSKRMGRISMSSAALSKGSCLTFFFFSKIQITCRTCYNAHVPLDYGNCQD